MPDHRIISLIASATEIVCALGYEEQMVGRSHECDYPVTIERLPVCSESRVDIHASSRSIDDQVKAAVADALSVYRVHEDKLDALGPTLIITQTQCDVCAVSLKDVEEAVCRMVGSRPKIVTLEPMQLSDVWTDIRMVAVALDDKPAGEQLIASLQSRLDALAESIPDQSPRPKILCLEWLDPPMSGGNWIPELAEIAGGDPILSEAGQHSPWITWDDVAVADPDVIAMIPCGFDIARIIEESAVLKENSAWNALRAVREGNVYVTDGNQYFNRPGPRVVESAEILAEILYPGAIPVKHRGTGWVPY